MSAEQARDQLIAAMDVELQRRLDRARARLGLDAKPDKDCATLPDGDCIAKDCMHTRPPRQLDHGRASQSDTPLPEWRDADVDESMAVFERSHYRSPQVDIRRGDHEPVNAGQVRRDAERGPVPTAVCTDPGCVIKMQPHSHKVAKPPYPWCRGNPTIEDCSKAGYCRRDPNCGD